MGGIFREMRHNWRSILQMVKTNDLKWADLEVEFMPAKVLMELFSPSVKEVRWNVDVRFPERFETSMACSKL